MKRLLFLLLTVFSFAIKSQTLNVPPRLSSYMTGSQFTAAIAPLSFTSRENLVYNEFIKGNVPNFLRVLCPVTSTALISGVPQSVTYYVIPDYIAIGSDTDYFLCPMSPMVSKKIADSIGCTLPTRKMVNDIYAQSILKLSPLTIPASGTMSTVQAFEQHNLMVGSQRSTFTNSLGTLTGGDKKDVVISNQIYTTANRVVIYGWHTAVGSPIQPLSNVHGDTYMDYSHGIRLVQNAVIYNGVPNTVKGILQSSTLNALLSDEGVISQPYYPYYLTLGSLSTPVSFAVINKTNNTLEIKVKNDNNATHYKIYTSTTGTSFGLPVTQIKTNLIISPAVGQICYVKIAAYNSTYSITSGISEVLAAVPCNYQDSVLLVNGFDRFVTGNTYDFVRQHGASVKSCNKNFSSATNEAIQDGLVNLSIYKAVDWILGKESTANETFNSAEQTLVQNYLQQGGNFFTSGSEIGWDLDNSGSVADKSFYNNYLKASYVTDAPSGQASTWYKTVNESAGSIFNFNDTTYFDNGTNGTYNVDYPDVINPINGGIATLRYTSAVNDKSAVYFSGMFTGGTSNGKLVYLGFPFETIYNSAKRNSMMSDILNFFFVNSTVTTVNDLKNDFKTVIYPNPCSKWLNVNSEETIIKLELIDVTGKIVLEKLTDSISETLNILDLTEGVYFLKISTKKGNLSKRVSVLH
ncbi:MAG: T9SS type A sorting domain-containing protein [Bacteroidota bacterium]|nr:T9SS type A sorting domain-containing protein [Bacteroidota bacterium]